MRISIIFLALVMALPTAFATYGRHKRKWDASSRSCKKKQVHHNKDKKRNRGNLIRILHSDGIEKLKEVICNNEIDETEQTDDVPLFGQGLFVWCTPGTGGLKLKRDLQLGLTARAGEVDTIPCEGFDAEGDFIEDIVANSDKHIAVEVDSSLYMGAMMSAAATAQNNIPKVVRYEVRDESGQVIETYSKTVPVGGAVDGSIARFDAGDSFSVQCPSGEVIKRMVPEVTAPFPGFEYATGNHFLQDFYCPAGDLTIAGDVFFQNTDYPNLASGAARSVQCPASGKLTLSFDKISDQSQDYECTAGELVHVNAGAIIPQVTIEQESDEILASN